MPRSNSYRREADTPQMQPTFTEVSLHGAVPALAPSVELARFLEGVVRRAGSPSDLRGRLCIGVEEVQGGLFWLVEFWPHLRTAITPAPPRDLDLQRDVIVRLDRASAQALLIGKRLLQTSGISCTGHRALLAAFAQRYLRSPVAHMPSVGFAGVELQ